MNINGCGQTRNWKFKQQDFTGGGRCNRVPSLTRVALHMDNESGADGQTFMLMNQRTHKNKDIENYKTVEIQNTTSYFLKNNLFRKVSVSFGKKYVFLMGFAAENHDFPHN